MVPFNASLNRRQFVSVLAAGSAVFLPLSDIRAVRPTGQLSIKEAIDRIIAAITQEPYASTVDTVKSGDPSIPLSGIVTTMFATLDVIRKAAALKANLIIAHEPTFYNHTDDTGWLEDHDVFRFKRDLLATHNIVVWRFHDYWHANKPDGIRQGVLAAVQWEKYQRKDVPSLLRIPAMSLREIAIHFKKQLGITSLRTIGDLAQRCETVGLLPGAPGGRSQMMFTREHTPDVLITGELQEWETSEYYRDLASMGRKQSLIVLGHSVSEEPGMRWLVDWLKPKFPGTAITHLPSGDPFTWL
jgi:putative NIF3 family GTP cyclohydrolase 1 type 2